MGLGDIALLALLFYRGRKKPETLYTVCRNAGPVETVLVDGSWLLHNTPLSRAASIAILVAHCDKTRANVATALTSAYFSSDGVVGGLIAHLKPHGKPAVSAIRIVVVFERGSGQCVSARVWFLSCVNSFGLTSFPLSSFNKQVSPQSCHWCTPQ